MHKVKKVYLLPHVTGLSQEFNGLPEIDWVKFSPNKFTANPQTRNAF